MVLELAVSKKISDFSSSLQIFSDSQSAVGILTLNWASTDYTVLISQIKSLLQQLQSTALDVSLHWTPGHATIAGNEISDRLAKDAAHQALEMLVDTPIVTIQDIKNSSKSQLYLNGSRAGTFLSLADFSTPSNHLLIANHTQICLLRISFLPFFNYVPDTAV